MLVAAHNQKIKGVLCLYGRNSVEGTAKPAGICIHEESRQSLRIEGIIQYLKFNECRFKFGIQKLQFQLDCGNQNFQFEP